MNILFGSSGLVGSFIAKQLKETEHKFLAVNRKKLSFLSDEEQQIVIDIKANAFLHHMVRNIAGVLMAIGSGQREPIWAKEVLDARDRTKGGVTASPCGLYFVDVGYDDVFELPPTQPAPYFIAHLMPF